MLSDDEKLYFSRQIVLSGFGESGQLKIKQAKVLVVGIGGLGTFSCLLLAEMGIGYLRIIDRDIIERTNLHRTPLYTEADLDRAKVEVAAERLKQLNPSMTVDTHACHIGAANIDELLEGIDIVIDGLDNFETRRIINQSCVQRGIPFVFCGVSAHSGNLALFNVRNDSPCLSCIYHYINDDDLESCDITGIHPSLLAIVTGIQVYEAVNILLENQSSLENSLLFIDLPSMNFDKIPLRKNPNCPVCSDKEGHKDMVQEARYRPLELCGGNSVMIVPQYKLSFNLPAIKSKLEVDYQIKKEGHLALTFELKKDMLLTLFQGGNVLIRGVTSENEALVIWSRIQDDYEIK